MLCQKLKDGKESSVPSTQRRFRTEMAMAQDCKRWRSCVRLRVSAWVTGSRILRILREEVMTMWDNQTIVDDQVVEFIREDKFDEEGRRAPTEWATEFANGFTTGKVT